MSNRFLSFLLASTIFSVSFQVYATVEVSDQLSASEYSYTTGASSFIVNGGAVATETGLDNIVYTNERLNFSNSGNLQTQDGYVYYMDSQNGRVSGTAISNSGSMLSTGNGYAVYSSAIPGAQMTTTITNSGNMDRIYLLQSDKSSLDNTGKINGSVILGTKANIENFGQMLSKDNDVNKGFENWQGSLIYLDRDSDFKNGFKEKLVMKDDNLVLDVELTPSATVRTDNIFFKQSGVLSTSSIINNQSIKAGDTIDNASATGFKMYLKSNPYFETDLALSDRNETHLKYFTNKEDAKATSSMDLPTVITGEMSLGDKAFLRADQGSIISADSLMVGEQSEIQLGADYYWTSDLYESDIDGTGYNWEREITVVKEIGTIEEKEVEQEEGEGEEGGTTPPSEPKTEKYIEIKEKEEKRVLEVIPLGSVVDVDTIQTGKDSKLSAKYTTFGSKDVTFGDNNTVVFEGSDASIENVVAFGKNGTLNLNGVWQEKVIYSDHNTKIDQEESLAQDEIVYIESKMNAHKEENLFVADNIFMGEGAKITLTGITVPKDPVNSKLTDDSVLYVAKELNVGDNSQIVLSGSTLSGYSAGNPDIKLGDNSSILTADQTSNILNVKSVQFGDKGAYIGSADWFQSDGEGGGVYRIAMEAYLEGDMIFGNDGYFKSQSYFAAQKLDMNDRATVDIFGSETISPDGENVVRLSEVEAEINLGSNSVVNLKNAGITNGLFKKEGRKNVNVYSNNSAYDLEGNLVGNYLYNGVTVDNIFIQTGELVMGKKDLSAKGDIYGKIWMDSNTVLHIYGDGVNVWDPVKRNGNAENTMVWFDLADQGVFNTLNTFDTDVAKISSGVLNVKHKITANDIFLDTAGSLRVFDTSLIQANVSEWKTTSANTTLFIAPKNGVMDSFGTVSLDRLVIENGTFNANHTLFLQSEHSGMPEGIWLDNNTTLNINNDVLTSQIVRRKDASVLPIEDTTVALNRGSLTIKRAGDLDNLILNNGTFKFLNEGLVTEDDVDKNLYISNDITVGKNVDFYSSGSNDVGSGQLHVGRGFGTLFVDGLIGVNSDSVDTTGIGVMKMNTNLVMRSDSTIDLRNSDAGTDTIHVSGQAVLNDGINVILRGLKEGTSYQILTADNGLSVSPNALKTSFLWHDTDFSVTGNSLYLTVGHLEKLPNEYKNAGVSGNVLAMADALDQLWDGNRGLMDAVFYASNVEDSVKATAEYIPDGFINAPQSALRTSTAFQNIALGVIDDTRQLSKQVSTKNRIRPTRRNTYYGRSGGDRALYQTYVGQRQDNRSVYMNRSRKFYRTDKGGIWAKPFYASMTQDDVEYTSGYDFNSYGLAVGLDKTFGRWAWGLSGLYATGDFETTNGSIKADTDTYGVGLYGSYRSGRTPFFMDLFASYVVTGNDSKHAIQSSILKADYDIKSIGAGLSMGYDISLGGKAFLTPKVGFNWTRISSDKIEEEGTAPIVMDIENPDIDSMQIPVEVRLAFPVQTATFELMPEMHFRYTHDFGDTDYRTEAKIRNTDLTVKFDNIGMPENLFTLGGSLGFTSGAHEFSGRYDYEFGDDFVSHLFNVGYKYLF